MATKKEIREQEQEAKRQASYVKQVRVRLGHLWGQRYSDTDILVGYHAGIEAPEMAAQKAAQSPVGAAVHPLKDAAIKWAGEEAARVVEKVRAELEAAGWDIIKVAPYPNTKTSREEYRRAHAKYSLYGRLTKHADPHDYRPWPKERQVVMDEKGIERFTLEIQRDAAAQYDEFICKLVSKVGEVTHAELSGNHVWSYSILTITREDGSGECWKTQQIVNYSKYGLPFAQWPTRLVK